MDHMRFDPCLSYKGLSVYSGILLHCEGNGYDNHDSRVLQMASSGDYTCYATGNSLRTSVNMYVLFNAHIVKTVSLMEEGLTHVPSGLHSSITQSSMNTHCPYFTLNR